jgi:glycosyltransferase involved in cell wall biosynthesis
MSKITIISIFFPPETGAAAARIAQMASGLRERGLEVNVLTALPNYPTGRIFPEYRGKLMASEVADGIPVRRYWLFASNSANAVKRILNMVSFSVILLLSLPHLLRVRPETIIVNSPPLPVGFSAVLLAKILRANLITNVSDIWPLSALELGAIRHGLFYSLLERIELFIYRHSDAIMTQSEETQQHVLERYPDKRTFLYRNLDYVSKAIDTYPSIQSKPVKIIYAGLLGIAQGVYAICESVDFRRIGVEFHIFGDGNERTKIAQFVSERPDSNIFMHDPVPKQQIPEVLAEYHATIIPLRSSIHGAFPSKIYMAMSASLPILFCGAGEGASFVKDMGIGWVAGPADYPGLSKCITAFSQMTDGEYESLREHIKRLATNEFGLAEQLDRLIDFVRKPQ